MTTTSFWNGTTVVHVLGLVLIKKSALLPLLRLMATTGTTTATIGAKALFLGTSHQVASGMGIGLDC